MKITAISDLHGNLPKINSDTELVLIAGDICVHGSVNKQLIWLDIFFRKWLESIKVPVIGVAGNHDWPFYEKKSEVQKLNLPWIYLEDDFTTVNGLKIWGTPWQREFFNWAFNLKPHELAEKWSLIDKDTDILICHGPPYKYGDLTTTNEHVGCPHLLQKIEEIKPKLVVYGHIHPGRGNWTLNETLLANVTVVNENYNMVYEPFECEI